MSSQEKWNKTALKLFPVFFVIGFLIFTNFVIAFGIAMIPVVISIYFGPKEQERQKEEREKINEEYYKEKGRLKARRE